MTYYYFYVKLFIITLQGGIKTNEFEILENMSLCLIIGSKNKSGLKRTDRSLAVCFRKEDPIFKEIKFETIYIYSVCLPSGAITGNHYHKVKREIFYCPFGQSVIVALENPATKERKVVMLSNRLESKFVKLIYIKPGIAHAVRNLSGQDSSLMVFSDIEEHHEKDDYEYPVI